MAVLISCRSRDFHFFFSRLTAGNFIASYAIFDRMAEQHSIPSMFYKAIMLYDGLGTEENPTEALALMKKVYELARKSLLDIELRHLACYHIGCAYNSGYGVRHDSAEAAIWWKKAGHEVLFNPEKSVGTRGGGGREYLIVSSELPHKTIDISRV